MNIYEFSLQPDKRIRAAILTEEKDIQKALTELEIPHPHSVIVLVGGARGVAGADIFLMRKAIRIIARLAEETQSVVLDGGTQSGIMLEIGDQRKQNQFSFPLIGVLFERLLLERNPQTTLDSNHTHFFLVPGEHWGDESAWISKIATQIANDKKSITVLVNGGNISRNDVAYSAMENRPTFVMRGTGRIADEIIAGDKIIAVDISEQEKDILDFLKSKLR